MKYQKMRENKLIKNKRMVDQCHLTNKKCIKKLYVQSEKSMIRKEKKKSPYYTSIILTKYEEQINYVVTQTFYVIPNKFKF